MDGNISVVTTDTVDESNDNVTDETIEYDTEDEAFPVIKPANFTPFNGRTDNQGQGLLIDVSTRSDLTSPLPLCLLFNARSVHNKRNSLRDLLHQVSPDLCLISETFETNNKKLSTVLENTLYKSISYFRKNRAPGGGCGILYNEHRFSVLDLDIPGPQEVENVWAMFTPKHLGPDMRVKRIAVGSYYISPRSRHKKDTIEHIIDVFL